METYTEMQKRQQDEYNEFTKDKVIFAFSNKQLNEAMAEKGVSDLADLVNGSIPGMFIIKKFAPAYKEFSQRIADETEAAIKADTTGDGFIYEMFDYELANHEFSYTGDPEETIEACGLTWNEILNTENLRNGFLKAVRKYFPSYKLPETYIAN